MGLYMERESATPFVELYSNVYGSLEIWVIYQTAFIVRCRVAKLANESV